MISCRSATCQFAFSKQILVLYCPRLAFESTAGPHYFWGGCFWIIRNFTQGSWQHSSYPCSTFWCQHNSGALSPFALDLPSQALKLCDEPICHRCHLRLCSLQLFECFYGYWVSFPLVFEGSSPGGELLRYYQKYHHQTRDGLLILSDKGDLTPSFALYAWSLMNFGSSCATKARTDGRALSLKCSRIS